MTNDADPSGQVFAWAYGGDRGSPRRAVGFGVHPSTVHRWVGRYLTEQLAGLADRSHRPPSSPGQVAEAVEVAVAEMRREHPRWGSRRIRLEMLRRPGAWAGEELAVPSEDAFVSHANAALTIRARLRLARLVVDEGWSVARAAERCDVSWPTAKRWAVRYAEHGPAPMSDLSSRPHHSPAKIPQPTVRKIVHQRWKQRLGPVQIAGQLAMPASTVHAVLTRCRVIDDRRAG